MSIQNVVVLRTIVSAPLSQISLRSFFLATSVKSEDKAKADSASDSPDACAAIS